MKQLIIASPNQKSGKMVIASNLIDYFYENSIDIMVDFITVPMFEDHDALALADLILIPFNPNVVDIISACNFADNLKREYLMVASNFDLRQDTHKLKYRTLGRERQLAILKKRRCFKKALDLQCTVFDDSFDKVFGVPQARLDVAALANEIVDKLDITI